MARYLEAGAKRKDRMAFAELDRIVSGTSFGVSIAFDPKKKAARKWQSIRRKAMPVKSKGLTGDALYAAVMGIAAADSSLVKIEAA